MSTEISHKEIYERLLIVESEVAKLRTDTSDLLGAFQAAKGAFAVLELIGKIAKPLLLIGSVLAAFATYWNNK